MVEVQTVIRFCPVMRADEELDRGDPRGDAHAEPVNRNQEHVLDDVILSPLGTPDHVIVEVQEVAEDQGKRTHI